jgi:prevent-host-death family protein
MDVGVRELKQRLSEFLDRAARGEVIRVTDRGQPKALLCPVPGVGHLLTGVEEGWIRVAEKSAPTPIPRFKSKRSIAETLTEDRDE